MRKIFLHAGQPKTGTSAIQFFCGENRDQLLRLGYVFPSEGLSHIHSHGPLIAAILGEPTAPQHRSCAQNVMRAISAHEAANVIISAERLFPYFQSCLMKGADDTMITGFFSDIGIATTIVTYIRPDVERLNSTYVQKVKSFATDATIPEFVATEMDRVRVPLLRLLALTRPPRIDMIFRPYTGEVRRAGVVRDFLAAIGLSADAIATLGDERRVNDPIGPVALEAARQTVKRIKEEGAEPSLRQRNALRARLFELIERAEPEPSFHGIDAGLSERIRDGIGPDRDAFSRAVWGAGWEAIFKPEERQRQCNAFDPRTAEPQALEHYHGLLDALWSAARAIMADPALRGARSRQGRNMR